MKEFLKKLNDFFIKNSRSFGKNSKFRHLLDRLLKRPKESLVNVLQIKPHFKRTMHEPNMSKGKFKAKGESATKNVTNSTCFVTKRQKKQASGNIGITNVFIFGHKHSKWSTRESVKKYKRVRVAIMVWLNHGALIN